jgi:hypothetical protein
MQALLIWLFVLFALVLPCALTLWLWKGTKSRSDWALSLLLVGAYALLIFLGAQWAIVSYYLRFLLIPFFVLAAYFSFRKIKNAPPQIASVNSRIIKIGKVFALLLLLLLNVEIIVGYLYPVPTVELTFPLRDGVYYVWQGGNSFITNVAHRQGFHQVQETYAIDIVKLNRAGNRATGLYPSELSSYAIYGATVYSPCDGEIIEIVDGRPDNAIGYIAGHPSNHVVIRCKGVKVTLAHMMNGSILVENGQSVKEGQPLGRVGNSGNSIEPHLHIDAVRDIPNEALGVEEPMPISFNGKVLSLNDVIRR